MKFYLLSLIACLIVVVVYNFEYLSSQFIQFSALTRLSSLLSLSPALWKGSESTLSHLPFVSPAFFAPSKAANMSVPRAIRQAFLATEQSEGAGARVRRSIGTPKLRNLSPFLMLDHFATSDGAGFPDHPHRGQETITYLLQGAVDHEDFTGSSGTLEAGDLQFMTAGRGIMHAEMPRQNADGSPNVGMQLWVDLPQKLKKCEPRYRDLRASEIPKIELDDGKVSIKIISGQSHGTDSVQELAYTPVWLFDITIKPGGKVMQTLPVGWNAFAYVLAGSAAFGTGSDQTTVGQYHNVVFEQKGDFVSAEVAKDADENAQFSKYYSPNDIYLQRNFRITDDSTDTNYSHSSCRRAPSRSKSRTVRPVRTQFTGGSLPSHDGLPISQQRL